MTALDKSHLILVASLMYPWSYLCIPSQTVTATFFISTVFVFGLKTSQLLLGWLEDIVTTLVHSRIQWGLSSSVWQHWCSICQNVLLYRAVQFESRKTCMFWTPVQTQNTALVLKETTKLTL